MKSGKYILVVVALMGWASSRGTAKTLVTGVALRMNDQYNTSIDSLMKGIETAKALFEEKNQGVSINLKLYPHGPALSSVSDAADQIIKSGTPIVIGGELSEESIVLGDKLGPKSIVLITPTSSSPQVTENKPFAFRACFSDTQVADELAKFVKASLKPASVGVLQNVSSPYTDYLSSRFTDTYKTLLESESVSERKSIVVQKILRHTVDFSSNIDFFIANKVTHVAMFTHDYEITRFSIQAANKGFFPVYIGSDGWGNNEFVFENLVKNAPSGDKFIAYRNSYWKEDSKSAMVGDFQRTFQAKFHKNPDAWSAIAFDSAWIAFTAQNNAKNPTDGESIRQSFRQLQRLKLVTSDTFSFEKDNSPKKDLFIYKISKKGVTQEATLK